MTAVLLVLIVLVVGIWWVARAASPYNVWRVGSECERCGHIVPGFDTKVWGKDKTCERCGPNSTFRRVYAKPGAFYGNEVIYEVTREGDGSR